MYKYFTVIFNNINHNHPRLYLHHIDFNSLLQETKSSPLGPRSPHASGDISPPPPLMPSSPTAPQFIRRGSLLTPTASASPSASVRRGSTVGSAAAQVALARKIGGQVRT